MSTIRLDDLGIKGFGLYQDSDQFCFGMDAVLLSSYARVYEGDRVIDLCSGNGIIPVLLAAKTKASKIYGVEIQKAPVDLAKKSVAHNNLTDRVEIILGDLRKPIQELPDQVQVVTVNPPYIKPQSGVKNAKSPLILARHEVSCTLMDILRCAAARLMVKGRFYMVHRPLRLVEILTAMSSVNLEPKSLRFVHPFIDKEPNMVLIEGIKGASAELRVAPPLIVYDAVGQYSTEVMEIYGL